MAYTHVHCLCVQRCGRSSVKTYIASDDANLTERAERADAKHEIPFHFSHVLPARAPLLFSKSAADGQNFNQSNESFPSIIRERENERGEIGPAK